MQEPPDVGDLDPDFEQPWVRGDAALDDRRREEKSRINDVRGVVAHFVAEMAERRKKWKIEYDSLQREFAATARAPSILDFRRRRRYGRYRALERIFKDFPARATYAARDVHRKTHGGLAATFRVRDDLEDDLAIGLFQPGATYDAAIRFSNGNPKAQADYAPDARGMAVKLLPARTLPYDDDPKAVVKQWLGGHRGQEIDPLEINRKGLLDIVTINFPVFFLNSPAIYTRLSRFALHISDDEDAVLEHKLSELKSALFSGMSAWERELGANINGSIIYNPLYQKYYSMAPSRLGPAKGARKTAVKYIWAPCRGERYDALLSRNNPPWADIHKYAHPIQGLLSKWRNPIPPEVKRSRNHLRAMIAQSLDERVFTGPSPPPPVCFDLQVQTFLNATDTPIEDVTSIWLESEEQRAEWLRKSHVPAVEREALEKRKIAPARKVGTLTISPLPVAEIEPMPGEQGMPETHNRRYIEDLSFNPWNNVPEEHRPLGVVQRMKRQVYAGSRNARFEKNQVSNVFSE
jgi:hypothetical protein